MGIASIVMLIALPLLLMGSAFFSGCETALFSLTRHQRSQLARSGAIYAGAITALLSETRPLLITLLLGNMLVNVLYINICAVLLIQLAQSDLGSPLILTVCNLIALLSLIMMGEVLPKLAAARVAPAWSRAAAVPLLVIHRTIAPIRAVSSALVITPLARLIAPGEKPSELSADELESLLKISQRHGVIDPGEEQLLQQVLELSQLKVRDLMTPRVDIQAYDLEDDPARLKAMALNSNLRHIPAYRGTLDQIAGLIYVRQVLLRPPTTRDEVEKLIRQVQFVPEQQRADRLLVELRKSGTTFAIVVDEYGGTAGLITLEDVVEHMVGDIPGAFEPSGSPRVESLGPARWRVGGDLLIHNWPEVFGRHRAFLHIGPGEGVSTVGGLVMAQLGRVPRAGDRITLGNVAVTVERMDHARVHSVLIELKSQISNLKSEALNSTQEARP